MSAQKSTPLSGHRFLAIGPFVWGKGVTREAAIRRALAQGIPSYQQKPYRFTVYEITAADSYDAYVDEAGRIYGCTQKGSRAYTVNGLRGKIREAQP